MAQSVETRYERDFAIALADFLIRGVDAGSIDRIDAVRSAMQMHHMSDEQIDAFMKCDVVMALLHRVWQ